jgi:hypothetical protein
VGSPFEVSPRILRLGGQSPWHHPPSQFNPGHETQRHQAKNGYIDFPDVKGGRDTPNMGSKSKAASAFLNAGEILSVMPMSSILKRDRTKMLDEILEKDSKDSGSLKLLIGSDSDWLKFVVDKYKKKKDDPRATAKSFKHSSTREQIANVEKILENPIKKPRRAGNSLMKTMEQGSGQTDFDMAPGSFFLNKDILEKLNTAQGRKFLDH